MIPDFNHSHVLPPFVGDSPTQQAHASPYPTTAAELVHRLGHTNDRRQILRGLLGYREALRGLGFVNGVQWVDGSFVEDVEKHQNRAPRDIDVVTFAYTPVGLNPAQVLALARDNPTVFLPAEARARFSCDAYLVPLDGNPEKLLVRAAYYHGLFSHRRGDNVWKGLLTLPLQSDDAQALATLTRFDAGDSHAASA